MTGYTCLHVDLLKIVLSYIYILVLRLETLNEKNIGMYSCHQKVSIQFKYVVKGYKYMQGAQKYLLLVRR